MDGSMKENLSLVLFLCPLCPKCLSLPSLMCVHLNKFAYFWKPCRHKILKSIRLILLPWMSYSIFIGIHTLSTLPCERFTASWPKRVLHWLPSSASFFNFHYSFFPLKSCSSFLRLLPRLLSHLSFVFSFNNVLEGSLYTRCDQSSYPCYCYCFLLDSM
jgi:hypothetical protein